MLHGYPLVKTLCGGLQEFMKQHSFQSVEEFRGQSLQYFTTHHELVRIPCPRCLPACLLACLLGARPLPAGRPAAHQCWHGGACHCL